MIPQEKAKELVNKFYVILMKKNYPNVAQMDAAKECALMAVDEIKEQLLHNLSNDISAIHAIYWEKVKQEIEKL
jgi:hypothetical protein